MEPGGNRGFLLAKVLLTFWDVAGIDLAKSGIWWMGTGREEGMKDEGESWFLPPVIPYPEAMIEFWVPGAGQVSWGFCGLDSMVNSG